LNNLKPNNQPVQPAQELNVWGQIETQLNQTFLSKKEFDSQNPNSNDQMKKRLISAAQSALLNEASTCSEGNKHLLA
jgi:hypothetical protein